MFPIFTTISVSNITLPPSLNITLLPPTILFEEFGLTTFQKFSLYVIYVMRLTSFASTLEELFLILESEYEAAINWLHNNKMA